MSNLNNFINHMAKIKNAIELGDVKRGNKTWKVINPTYTHQVVTIVGIKTAKSRFLPVSHEGHGIETEIRKVGQTFYLVTKDKYDNPQRPGTDGYKARQRIVELGTGYVPPPGFGSFDFRSAYGMKFGD